MCITTHPIQKPVVLPQLLFNPNQPQRVQSDAKPDLRSAADKLGPDPSSLVREAREVGCLPLPSSGNHQDKQWTTPNPHPLLLLPSLSLIHSPPPLHIPPWHIHPGVHSNTKPTGYHVVNYSTLTNPRRSRSLPRWVQFVSDPHSIGGEAQLLPKQNNTSVFGLKTHSKDSCVDNFSLSCEITDLQEGLKQQTCGFPFVRRHKVPEQLDSAMEDNFHSIQRKVKLFCVSLVGQCELFEDGTLNSEGRSCCPAAKYDWRFHFVKRQRRPVWILLKEGDSESGLCYDVTENTIMLRICHDR